jgi:hypothetical protein
MDRRTDKQTELKKDIFSIVASDSEADAEKDIGC